MTTSLSASASWRRWLRPIVALLAAACAPAAFAQTGGATVTGSVINAATRGFLEGAQVTLVGTAHDALTGRDGQFQITGVAPGEYTLEVTYTGLDPQQHTITVAPGRNAIPVLGLTSDIYLDSFTVSGEREGSAAAITAQRHAANVKSVVATDTFATWSTATSARCSSASPASPPT